MTELRHNYLTDEWVCIATKRGDRPQHFKKAKDIIVDGKDDCPFCPENSDMTDANIYISNNKRVRIVPNKYPVVEKTSETGFGIHDVVIETPNHYERFTDFSEEGIFDVLEAIKIRLEALSKIKEIKYIQVFKNEGGRGGASIFHSHTQIVSLPFVPLKQKTINGNFKKYYDEHKSCYLCNQFENLNSLIVLENDNFIAYMPYASIYAYAVEIAPKSHISDFKNFTASQLKSLSEVLKKILTVYNNIFEDFSYNICFQNAPYNNTSVYNHFYLQIIPRIANFAGFEISTGCYINSVDVYNASKKIREML